MAKIIIMIVTTIFISLLTSCASTEIKMKPDKQKNKVMLPALVQEECADYKFLYGIVRPYGNKQRIDGYKLETGKHGNVYLLNLKRADLKDKYVVAYGKFHSIHIGGLLRSDGKSSGSYQQSSLENAKILQVVKKGQPVDSQGIDAKCKMLKSIGK